MWRPFLVIDAWQRRHMSICSDSKGVPRQMNLGNKDLSLLPHFTLIWKNFMSDWVVKKKIFCLLKTIQGFCVRYMAGHFVNNRQKQKLKVQNQQVISQILRTVSTQFFKIIPQQKIMQSPQGYLKYFWG
jgi:hypothetical protein